MAQAETKAALAIGEYEGLQLAVQAQMKAESRAREKLDISRAEQAALATPKREPKSAEVERLIKKN